MYFKSKIYPILTKLIPASRKFKLISELTYWYYVKLKEGKLNHNHFKYFQTEYFGIEPEYYNDKIVLDIGCGPRGSLEWMSNAKYAIGLDPLADHYLKINSDLQNMKMQKGEGENIPFENEHFDVVFSFNSLDHVDDLEAVITEIDRVLKKGGEFLLIVEKHPFKGICEPQMIDMTVLDMLKKYFSVNDINVFEGDNTYKTIRKGVEYDLQNEEKRYGVITARCFKQ